MIHRRLAILLHAFGTVDPIWPPGKDYEIVEPDPSNDFIAERNITGLSLQNGRRYSLEVTAINHAGLASKHVSHGVTVDTTPPVMQKVCSRL